ncbi:CpaD family pilus assembly protein [Hyphococcus sp. DH-69]|uniref:CpaD family pilus assembly protein n=1 Tax=Hyphococcus formosus TaxID=3143534 RepID=UPI00398BBC28
MNAKTMKYAFLSAASLLVVGCAGGPFNGPQHSMTIAESHPISVDSQVVTLTINVDSTTSELSNVDKARLKAFADSYLTNGHGVVTVTAPSGAGNDNDGHETAADIRKVLNDSGVSWSAMHGATYRAGSGDGEEIVLSFTRYVASASPCGIWKGMKEREYRNLRTPNMGCATMNNYAAMIADPHDLIAPADKDPRDGESVVRAIKLYREGQVTASAVDANIDAETSGN